MTRIRGGEEEEEEELKTRWLKIARGRPTPPQQHVCNGLARPADESTLARDNEIHNGAW